MNAGGAGLGGQSGTGSAESRTQNNGQKATTTSSLRQRTSTAYPQTQAPTFIQFPTSISSSSSSSGNQKIPIIGGVIGGLVCLLLVSLLVIWLLDRRQKKRIIEERGRAELVTSSSPNNSFARVSFHHSNRRAQHGSLFPMQALHTPRSGTPTPHSGVRIRGRQGQDSNTDGEHRSSDGFPPSYAESQARMSVGRVRSLGGLNTSHTGSTSEATISLMGVRHSSGPPLTIGGLSPQTTGGTVPFTIPQQTRDTIGFQIDASDNGMSHSSTRGLPIRVPIPRRPLVRQESLERLAREGMNGASGVQNSNLLGPMDGMAGRLLGEELMRESAVPGAINPIWIEGTAGPSNLSGGVQRFESQRTVSSVSSMGISVVSNTELERLGVGSRERHLR